jgi:sodium/bile acid cotransporter 7
VYNTFCNTFLSGFGVSGGKVTGLFVVLTVLLIGYKACVFFSANLVGLERKDTIAATFMGSQKTLAFGLPLIKALFGQSPDLVWYCLPILVYHPLQTFLGSALVPKLREWGEGDREGSTSSVNA